MGATPFSCCKERTFNEGLENPNKFIEKVLFYIPLLKWNLFIFYIY